MESKLDFLQNNEETLKFLFDNIKFESRVIEMKEIYIYEHEGVFMGKMYDLQLKEKKIELSN